MDIQMPKTGYRVKSGRSRMCSQQMWTQHTSKDANTREGVPMNFLKFLRTEKKMAKELSSILCHH